jgi:large subunit ribosomal protein L33
MSQDRLIKLGSKEAKGQTYLTTKNKKTVQKKLSLRKYSKKLRKHVVFNELKK